MTLPMKLIAVAAVAVGIIIYIVTSAIWQFVPIGFGLLIGYLAARLISSDTKPKGK